ncbi:serine hydrolase [Cohnella sp. REN36]|uniref:serine hydrolase domain-containing protein n=1 Tax=Cohnella sp. REN36 TaxID=2887347 RepID=UPI001D15352A|nr:serine hydrolase [Cohnella sp. REN36]MCC3377632.1 beta-lactamase family protein [Cohnella sp. REN36]
MKDTELTSSVPEREGVSSRALAAFAEALRDDGPEIDAFVLLRHGRKIAEGGWRPYTTTLPRLSNSVSKSFTSTAIGMAVDEGLLTVEDRVIDFFPTETPAEPGEHLRAMRVKHLLTMSTGHRADTIALFITARSQMLDWVSAFLQAPVEDAPGSGFLYNSGATYMLSAILQRVTGTTLFDYLKPRLFEPLGIREVSWEACPRGITTGGWGLSVSAESYAKFGQLYLDRGVWNGRRLLSEEWVAEASRAQIANAAQPDDTNDWTQGYGYQFWRCRHGAYRADGAFGQFIVVLPEQDAVLAIHAATYDMQPVLDIVWTHLLPALGGREALPPDPAGEERLCETLAALHVAAPSASDASELATAIDGGRYRFTENELGLREASLRFGSDEARLVMEGERGEAVHRFGIGAWIVNEDCPLRAASATWTAADLLQLTIRQLETAYVDTFEIRFDGTQTVRITHRRDYDVFAPSWGTLVGQAIE